MKYRVVRDQGGFFPQVKIVLWWIYIAPKSNGFTLTLKNKFSYKYCDDALKAIDSFSELVSKRKEYIK